MKTLLQVVDLAAAFLKEKGVDHPRREAVDLFSFALGMRPLDLYLQFDRPMQESELKGLRRDLLRRAEGEPLQYIRGEVEFLDCRLKVNPHVLIPRQETEILVDKWIKRWEKQDLEGKHLWDLCCGSGCIGIALKKRFPQLQVSLSDLSEQALDVARENAALNRVKVEFYQGDFLEPFEGQKADFILCNPPYIAEAEYQSLQAEVRDHEPRQALLGGGDGLLFYRRLAALAHSYLRPCGQLWLELGHRQGAAVEALFAPLGARERALWQDWSGHDRFFFLEIE